MIGKSKVWYREPWPWILIVLPLSAVIASLTTIWLAVKSDDGLVVDDYYKQGMAINQTLHRGQAAQALHLSAVLSLGAGGKTILLTLSGDLKTPPQSLALSFLHPTQAGRDHKLTLQANPQGRYIAAMPDLGQGAWRVTVEAPDDAWRLAGQWPAGQTEIRLGEAGKSE